MSGRERLISPRARIPILPRRIALGYQRTKLTPREKAIIRTSPRDIRTRTLLDPRGYGPTPPVTRAQAVIPPTLATGGGVPTTLPSIAGGLGGIGTSISGFGSSIMSQGRALVPIAVKIVAAVLVFKIVLWLIRGRRR